MIKRVQAQEGSNYHPKGCVLCQEAGILRYLINACAQVAVA